MTDQPEKMPLTSMDIAAEKRDALKQLFPEVFAEDRIDFDQLKRVLGDWVEPGKERFGLTWPGKAECMRIIQSPSIATLKPVREESVNFDETENVFIEGDNLEVLKLLQKAYFGKVKMIYIDPPYNTGGEFIYPDKYAETLDTYLAYTGQIDDEGRKFSTNTDAGGRYHSNWLSMMYPRLYLARGLLREDGVIFLTIDDNEAANLKMVLDQVFGEENFVTSIAWHKRVSPANDAKWFSSDHDTIFVYARNKEVWRPNRLERTENQLQYYKNPDNDPRGPWNSATYTCNKSKEERPNLYYPIRNPNTGEEVWPKTTAVWKYGSDETERLVADNRLYWGADGTSSSPRVKLFLSDMGGVVPRSIWPSDEVGHTQAATSELREIFDGEQTFDTPKPTKLIKRMIEISTSEPGDIVLDFFAGSASTAHAVMDFNNETGKSVRFVMVQLPEKCASPAVAESYETISAIGRERVRRSGSRLNTTAKTDAGSSDETDFGFRAFSLSQSNFRLWSGAAEDISKELDLHVQNVDPSATPEDIVYELLLKAGFPLTTKVKAQVMAGKTVYSVEDGSLLICLDKEITPALIDALADADPLQVICLDEGFKGNDQLKANAVQTFKARAASRETEIVFRTV
jgi:adenine-specific DNA-methyltransferase